MPEIKPGPASCSAPGISATIPILNPTGLADGFKRFFLFFRHLIKNQVTPGYDMVIGFVSGRTSWQLLRKPEQLTDPSPEGTFRPPAKWQSPRDM
jgi:hypothetical protein